MALVVQAYDVGGDPVVGSGQTAEKYAERIRDAFARKAPADACMKRGTRCARDNRRWQGRPPMSCLKKYKEVVSTCTKLRDKRKQVDAMELTGGPTEDELDRVALALFNRAVKIGDRQLIYAITTTPGYYIGNDFCYQDQYEFLVTRTTVLEAGGTPVRGASPNSVPQAASDTGATDFGNFPSATERRLGTKAAKRKKRSLESSVSSQADVASSVRDFSEFFKRSDEGNVQIQRQKLRLQEQSNRLRIYETLFLRDSCTASQEERQFAESRMRSMFFASLLDDSNTSLDAGAPAVPPSFILPHTPAEPSPSVRIAYVPSVHGRTMVDAEEEDNAAPQCAIDDCADVSHIQRNTEPTQLSKSLDDDSGDDEN
jgi:hypothetical protein